MFNSLDLVNFVFDAAAFGLSAFLYFQFIADQAFSLMDSIRVAFEFFIALVVASMIYKSVSGLPDFAISAKKDIGIDLIAISLFIIYYGVRTSFSTPVILPLLIIGLGAGLIGTFMKRVLSTAEFLPVSLQVDLKKMSELPPNIPAGSLSGGSLGL